MDDKDTQPQRTQAYFPPFLVVYCPGVKIWIVFFPWAPFTGPLSEGALFPVLWMSYLGMELVLHNEESGEEKGTLLA